MKEIENILLYKLSNRGLTPLQIPRLVKDVMNIVSVGGEFTAGMMNSKLEALGWDREMVDPFTFELILSLPWSDEKNEKMSTRIH
jgi:hypothetical protein